MRTTILYVQSTLLYEFTLAFAAILSVVLLAVEIIFPIPTYYVTVIHNIDLAIAFIFLADFSTGISTSYDRKKYFKVNWLNLASSIPVTNDLYRSLRILRLFRTMRVIRALAFISNTQRIRNATLHLKNK